MRIDELKQKRYALVKEARELLDRAEAEKRGLTAEEEQQYERIMTDVDKLGKQIEMEERLYNLEHELEKSAGTLAGGKQVPETQNRAIVNPVETAEYRDAFWKAMRYGVRGVTGDELRSLTVGTQNKGGYLVPPEFERTLLQALTSQNVMRGLATVISTSGEHNIPMVTGHGTATWTAEEGAYTESDETFGMFTLSAYKVTTMVKVSEELLADSAFDLENYLISEFARRFGEAEEIAFITGDGVGKPTGVLNTAAVGKTTAANNAITADEIIDLFYSLKRPYRQRATFLMNDATVKVLRKIKDNQGNYIWQPGLTAGEPDRLLGRPIALSDAMPTIASQAKVIAFGDFSYYYIADRQGRVFQRLDELFAANGQVGFRAYQRVDGKLSLAEAVQVLQVAV